MKDQPFNKGFLHAILTIIGEHLTGTNQSEVARVLNASRQRVNYHVNRAKANGFIETKRVGNTIILLLTDIGKQALINGCKKDNDTCNSLLHAPKINIHDYVLSVPVDKVNHKSASFKRYWKPEIEMRNTHTYYLKDYVSGVTLKIIGNTLFVYFHRFDVQRSLDFVPQLSLFTAKKLNKIKMILDKKFGIFVDIDRADCIRQHIANPMPELDGKISLQNQATMRLGRNAQSVVSELKEEAYATIDFTPPPHANVETNDVFYEHKFLMMPELIYQMFYERKDRNLLRESEKKPAKKSI